MIVCAGFIGVDPANADQAKAMISTLMDATRAEEGCLSYTFAESLDTAGEFRVFEEWADEDAINGHMASPHMAEFLGSAGPLITGANVDRYDVSDKTKLL